MTLTSNDMTDSDRVGGFLALVNAIAISSPGVKPAR